MIASRILRHWLLRLLAPDKFIREKYTHFKALLRADTQALDLIADLDVHLYGHDPADGARIRHLTTALLETAQEMSMALAAMNPREFASLPDTTTRLGQEISMLTTEQPLSTVPPYIIPLREAGKHPDQVGGKAANLSRAMEFGAPVPDGFVITAQAFARYLNDNQLVTAFETLFQEASLLNHAALVRMTGAMQEHILAANVPPDIAAGILAAANDMDLTDRTVAVRSSALSEDGPISFAGQYASELDVSPHDLLPAYKRVLAGKYCPRALAYRLRHGLSDNQTAMAVLVLPMIKARVAGVVYTQDPARSIVGGAVMGVYVVEGLAANLVDGSATPGKYALSREKEPRVLMSCASDTPTLPEEILLELGRWAMRLEGFFGCPQDLEWAWGAEGLKILQTRPLPENTKHLPAPALQSKDMMPLVADLDIAAPGVACGPVFHAHSGNDFRNIPPGAVVVTTNLRPALSQFLDHITAIVAENGSRASHLASVARERDLPVLVGCPTHVLESDQLVTVDGFGGRIFPGCLSETARRDMEEAKRHTLCPRHAELAKRTVHLDLTDPTDARFSVQGCRSLHDLVRFCHEKGVAEMFDLVDRQGRGMGRSRRLETRLPLVMYVLDLGGGLAVSAQKKGPVSSGQVTSIPLQALWGGLTDERIVWDTSQMHVDWETFDRVSAGIFRLDSRILASYAVIAREYMHVNIRFGYHFSLVDALCSETANANYITFRFKGGGAALDQRGYRLAFIDRVLTECGFETLIQADMLDASVARLDAKKTRQALQSLGLVLAATRLMDIQLTEKNAALQAAETFLQNFFPGAER